jgi:hypothetical protein
MCIQTRGNKSIAHRSEGLLILKSPLTRQPSESDASVSASPAPRVDPEHCPTAAGQPYSLVERARHGALGELRDRFAALAKKTTGVAADRSPTQLAQPGTVLAVFPAAQVHPGDPARVGQDREGDVGAGERGVLKHRDQPCSGRADGAGIEDREGAVGNVDDTSGLGIIPRSTRIGEYAMSSRTCHSGQAASIIASFPFLP